VVKLLLETLLRRVPWRRSAGWPLPALLAGAALLSGLVLWGFWPSSGLTDLVYATPDGVRLTLDIDYPASRRDRHPVVVFAPPEGQWTPALKREPRCRMLLEKLTGHGYAVATVHYRLPAQHRFPAQVEDGKAAVRWLRANADRLGLDARRIGVVGVSSGGYGACMLGTTGPEDGFEGAGGSADQSSRVQAVVCLGVPADFSVKTWPERLEAVYLRRLLGAGYAEDPGLYERASPGAYASPDDPPFLLFHSRNDLMVPVEMARAFAGRLRRAGVPVTLVEDEGIEHVWSGPKLERAIEQTLRFLDRHLCPEERAD
jgi:acetyl esterase/lipase